MMASSTYIIAVYENKKNQVAIYLCAGSYMILFLDRNFGEKLLNSHESCQGRTFKLK